MIRVTHILATSVLLVGLTAAAAQAFSDAEYEHEAIRYTESEPHNAVTRLQAGLDSGEVRLKYDEKFGWLPALLEELDVPRSSQMLVFSKTSLQRHRISPRRPRAIYFADDVYVGYCQHGDVIELSAVDPRLGAVFYTLDQEPAERPAVVRQTDNCLICHASSSHTRGVPGHVVRSVFVDAGGFPILSAGTYRTDQTSPIAQRWGGWYVSGTHGDQTHFGNLIVRDKTGRPERQGNPHGLNVTDLSERFDTSAYLTPHSDIAALMVLEHQTGMHNQITRAGYRTRRALWDEAVFDKALGESTEELRESTISRIEHAGDDLLEYLLFCNEAEITHRIAGTSGFAEEFASRGPRDSRGRSLRDLDLEHRLFRYPCSYLIHSDAFDALPQPVREYVLRRLWDILTGADQSKDYAHLTPADRRAVLEILRETKANLPEYWREAKAD